MALWRVLELEGGAVRLVEGKGSSWLGLGSREGGGEWLCKSSVSSFDCSGLIRAWFLRRSWRKRERVKLCLSSRKLSCS